MLHNPELESHCHFEIRAKLTDKFNKQSPAFYSSERYIFKFQVEKAQTSQLANNTGGFCL
ncbi:hypothetical protein QQP08_012282 [Theobroma cacao]|nr:hypothetical protein QQP08_012282 [Theobroma cacao]